MMPLYMVMALGHGLVLSLIFKALYGKAGLRGGVALAAWSPIAASVLGLALQQWVIGMMQSGAGPWVSLAMIVPQVVGLLAPLVLLFVDWPAQGRRKMAGA